MKPHLQRKGHLSFSKYIKNSREKIQRQNFHNVNVSRFIIIEFSIAVFTLKKEMIVDNNFDVKSPCMIK